MILAPRSRWTRKLMSGPWICALLSVLYAALVVPNIGELLPHLSRPTLEGIQALLSTPLGATAGWLHFLAFDLFVGRFIWNDVVEHNRSLWGLRAILPMTLMFGPLGLLGFLLWTRIPRPRGSALLSLSVLSAVCIALCLVGLAMDPRTITNLPAWMKPLKFSLSILIYCLTLEAVLKRLQRTPWAEGVRIVTALCLTIEMAIILLQTVRGTTSHFNSATPFDTALFAVMGAGIVPVWVAAMVVTGLLFKDRDLDPGLSTALKWGAGVSVVGMAWAWPMTAWGAHTVGAPDGGPGLPLLGWSTVAGDLRVPHFIGLHGFQIMALLWMLTPDAKSLRIHGGFLLATVCWLGLRACQGLSVLSWDPVLISLLGVWSVFLYARTGKGVPRFPS